MDEMGGTGGEGGQGSYWKEGGGGRKGGNEGRGGGAGGLLRGGLDQYLYTREFAWLKLCLRQSVVHVLSCQSSVSF